MKFSSLDSLGPTLAAALALGALSVATLASTACSSSSSPKACVAYQLPAGTDLTTPTVSFKSDVLPILVESCAFSSCHGAPSGGNNGVYFGSKTATNDPSAIRSGFVGVKAQENPSMNFVTAGDPSQSYVMHKLDADQCLFDAKCTNGSCQSSMPQSSDTLPEETRLVIRRWIAQGAADN